MQESSIPIKINGRPREVGSPGLPGLLQEIGIDPERRTGIAVALNGTVVPRASWAETTLSPGDELEVIGAVQGG